jgi:2-dehydro-3-deoxygluconokinase
MGKVVTFGEIMLRLSPPGHERFVQSRAFSAIYAGGEANVAVSLAGFGVHALFVTKLPRHEIAQAALNELRRYGVDTDHVVRGGDRLGVFFCENGASQRPSKVIYDRAHSALADACAQDFDWKKIFDGAQWYHFTGITPALSDGCASLCMDSVRAARHAGATISVDLNYRSKLWNSEKAGKVMDGLTRLCDVIIANEEDAEKVFGIRADTTDVAAGRLSGEGYEKVAAELQKRFGARYVAITLRESRSASDNGWSALLFDGTSFYKSRKYDIHIVDRVGGGDAFAGGLIYGLSSGMANQKALEFAVGASCLKHTIPGDFNMVSLDEVETLLKGDASGRVQR